MQRNSTIKRSNCSPAPHPSGAAHCHRGLGDVYRLQGRLDKAEVAFDLTEELYVEAKKKESIGVGLLLIGRAFLALERANLDDAIDLLEKAQGIFSVDKTDSPYDLARTHEALGDVYSASGDRAAASKRVTLARERSTYKLNATAQLRACPRN